MARPLSPHLTWYKPQITTVLSILHRLSGLALAVGSIALAWWVVAVAAGGGLYDTTILVYTSIIGQIFLFGWTVALSFHLANGIRHLFWDAGYGFEMTTANRSGIAVLVMTAVLTVIVWVIAVLGYA